MDNAQLSLRDMRVVAEVARLLLSTSEGRMVFLDILDEGDADALDRRLHEWLESSHLTSGGEGLN